MGRAARWPPGMLVRDGPSRRRSCSSSRLRLRRRPSSMPSASGLPSTTSPSSKTHARPSTRRAGLACWSTWPSASPMRWTCSRTRSGSTPTPPRWSQAGQASGRFRDLPSWVHSTVRIHADGPRSWPLASGAGVAPGPFWELKAPAVENRNRGKTNPRRSRPWSTATTSCASSTRTLGSPVSAGASVSFSPWWLAAIESASSTTPSTYPSAPSATTCPASTPRRAPTTWASPLHTCGPRPRSSIRGPSAQPRGSHPPLPKRAAPAAPAAAQLGARGRTPGAAPHAAACR
jgi:hypothetical protein